MATLRKRGSAWRAEVYRKGIRDSRSFDTKAEARAWAQQREDELDEGYTTTGKTLRHAFVRYAADVSETREGGRWEQIRLKAMARDMSFVDRPIEAVTPDDIGQWRDARLKKVKPGSVLRDMGLLMSVFERARKEWRWIRANPLVDVSKPPRPKHRTRRISEDEAGRVILALGYLGGKPQNVSQRIAVAFLLALETAMRSSEILGLTWPHVHLKARFLHVVKSKNGDERDVPLTREAVRLLKLLDPYGETVFEVDAGSRDTMFRDAVKRAKITGLTFHDSRHEACTRLARKIGVLDLAKMIGHRDLKSLGIYYNPTASEIASRLD